MTKDHDKICYVDQATAFDPLRPDKVDKFLKK